MKASALIPAAGSGERLGKGINKVFCTVGGKPILAHTLSVFESCSAVEEIILVVRSSDMPAAQALCSAFGFSKVRRIVKGGRRRQDSVAAGLELVTNDIVAIHDAARPFVTEDLIVRTVREAARSGACIAAVPMIDTVKRTAHGRVVETLDRKGLYAVQTPQTFRTDLIRRAHLEARAKGILATDDASLVEALGEQVTVVEGSYENIKVTTPADLEWAEARLAGSDVRTGIGYDVHRLVEGRRLILGGVDIPFPKGLEGHSDADVLTHAVMDALLGAACLGDIGRHFPDSDAKYKDASSLDLLAEVRKKLAEAGWSVVNIDAVVICEQPRIADFVNQMSERIAGVLQMEPDRISLKGTTTEGLGFEGRGEGIACQAVATVRRCRT
ncbi:MAG: 2-C-methyl-D-erythritol 4-phosphate cytidylyltransferase [Armatimonadota bacterium]|nr:2-C-methyl-D-erythritol 4-phosphate cytidylyltransferase [Armatimonadota bacterium]